MKNLINEFITQLNWVDVAVFALLLFSLIVGLIRGFFTQIAGIIGVLAALAVALHFGERVSVMVEETVSLQQKTAVIVSFAALFLGTWLVWLVLAHFVKKIMSALKFGAFDRVLGGAFGLVKGALVAYVVLVLIDGIFPGLNRQIEDSVSSKGVARIDRLLQDQRDRIPEPAWKVIAQLRKFPEDTANQPVVPTPETPKP